MSDTMHHLGPAEIYEKLTALHILFDYHEHPPAPTAAVAAAYWSDIDAGYCKNLFFRNHKGNKHFLVVIAHNQSLGIKSLEQKLRQGKITFASGWRLEKYLGTTTGAISPLGLVFDEWHNIHLFLDEALRNYDKLAFHPNDNRAAVVIALNDLLRFIDACGNSREFGAWAG